MHIYDLDSNDGVTDMDHVRDTLERMFPTEHECGIIPSVFATVDRTEWAHRRESITAELLTIAEDAIAEERFAPADDDQPLGITARTDGGYLAVLMHDGERVCTLVGCDLDSISERICDFDPIADKVDTEILAAQNGFFTELSNHEVTSAIGLINEALREPYRSERGDFSPSIFSSRNNWIHDLEVRGYLEISAHYANDRQPVVINRVELGGAK